MPNIRQLTDYRHQTKQSGFAPIILISIIAIITILSVYLAVHSTKRGESTTSPSPTSSATPNMSPSPSPTPTPIPTPPPTVRATPSSTLPPPPKITLPSITTPPSSGYAYITVKTDRGDFPIHIVTLQNPTMVTDTANDSDCPADCPTKPLADFVSQNGGFAGINGSYFCPDTYPECQNKKNSFDFTIYNSRLNKWINEGNKGWSGRSAVFQEGGNYGYRQNASDVPGARAVVINYPGILNDGNIVVEDSGLSDKQKNKGTKGGIGLNGNTVYLIIAPNVNMYEFALIFKTIGARSALNLDGGGSSALYFGGYKVGPGKSLPNAVVFK